MVSLAVLFALPVANASAVAVTPVRDFTCLNRTSDGFNHCWRDGTNPGDWGNINREFQKADGCNGSHFIFRSDTPSSAHGVSRASSVGLVLGGDAGNYLPHPVTWLSLGQGTNQYYGSQSDRTPGSIITQMPALSSQNSFARVRMWFSGADWCRWKV